ncbi:MAG: Transposase [Parcubacteria group bacterium GW2011_GWE2_40_8]|nr:MAG: Transposase [Parcubacteria group bacterium GW2011_GWE2_40_8]
MARNIDFSIGENYHLYGRGTDKRKIFLKKDDYERFISLLYICNNKDTVHISNLRDSTLEGVLNLKKEDDIVKISAYCLMPNHFHVLVQEIREGGVSKFMQKMMTGFKSIHANDDNHLKYLLAYIHLNPVKMVDPHWKENGISNKDKVDDFLKQYKYSSFIDYLGLERKEGLIIDKNVLPEYFDDTLELRKYLDFWLSYCTKV